MEYIKIGRVVTTHGIKGEIRILSDFKYKDKVFVKGSILYLGEEKKAVTINSHRVHKNYNMVLLDGYDNINQVLNFKGKNVYINKNEFNFDSYIDEELIGFDVIMNDKIIGKINNIIKIPNNSLFEIKNSEKLFYIPNNSELIIKIDFKNKILYMKFIEGLV